MFFLQYHISNISKDHFVFVRRETCAADEFEDLVQRNMAANCGLDFRAAAEFVGSIAARELSLIRQPAVSRRVHLMHLVNLKQALPVLEGLLAGLDSCGSSLRQNTYTHGRSSFEGSAQRASNLACDGHCPQNCAQCGAGPAAMFGSDDHEEGVPASVAEVLGCKSKDELMQFLRNMVDTIKAYMASGCVKIS